MAITPEQLQAFLDGDTAKTADGSVRFQKFDAPEMGHEDTSGLGREPGAELSRQYAEQYTRRPGVEIDNNGTDAYGRALGEVSDPAQGTTLAETMISRGLAQPTSNDPATNRAYYEQLRERRNPSTPEQAQINAVLDAEWAQAKPNRHNLRARRERTLGETFGDAVDRGLDQIGMMVGGTQKLAGEMTGIDTLAKAGEQRIRENQRDLAWNPPEVASFAEAKTVGDYATRTVELLGEQGPNLAAMIGTALATGGVGGVLEVGTAAFATEQLAANAAIKGLNLLGRGLTKELGAVAAGATMNIGESKLNLDEVDPNGDHNLLALGTGILKTGLDVGALGAQRVGKYLLPRAKALGLSPKDALKAWSDVPMAVLRDTLVEGSTEGMQGLLDEVAAKYKAGTPINWANVAESAAAGAIVGGTVSGLTGAGEVLLSQPPAETSPAADPTASDPFAGVTTPDLFAGVTTPDPFAGAATPSSGAPPNAPPPAAPAAGSPLAPETIAAGLRYSQDMSRADIENAYGNPETGETVSRAVARQNMNTLQREIDYLTNRINNWGQPRSQAGADALADMQRRLADFTAKQQAWQGTLDAGPVDPAQYKAAWTEEQAARAPSEDVAATNMVPPEAFRQPETPPPPPTDEELAALDAEAAQQAPVDPWANITPWVRDNLQPLAERAEQTGVADKIEELAAQRKVAKEIAAELGVDMDTVNAVRIQRNIPSWSNSTNLAGGGGQSQEFTDWLAARQRRMAPNEQQTPPTDPRKGPPGASQGKFRGEGRGTRKFDDVADKLVAYEDRDGLLAQAERDAKPDAQGRRSGAAAVRVDIVRSMKQVKTAGRLMNRIADAKWRLQQLREEFTDARAAEQKAHDALMADPKNKGLQDTLIFLRKRLDKLQFAGRAVTDDLVIFEDWLGQHFEKKGQPAPSIQAEPPFGQRPVKPEPAAQVEAQAAAVAEGVKPIGFVADGTPMPKLGDGLRAVAVPGGRVYGTNEQVKAFIARAKEVGLEKALGEAQGATRTKEEVVAAATPENPAVVVRRRDKAGNTISGAAALQSEVDQQEPPGPGPKEVVSVEEELAGRDDGERIELAYHRIDNTIYKAGLLDAVEREIGRLERTGAGVPKSLKAKRTRLRKMLGETEKKAPKRKYVKNLEPLKRDEPPAAQAELAPLSPDMQEEIARFEVRGQDAQARLEATGGPTPLPQREVVRQPDLPRKDEGRMGASSTNPKRGKIDAGPALPTAAPSPREPSQWADDRAANRPHEVDILGIPKNRAKAQVKTIGGRRSNNQLLRIVEHGTKQRGAPSRELGGPTAQLAARVRALPWVREHLMLKEAGTGQQKVRLFDGTPQQIDDASVADQHDLVVSQVTKELTRLLAEAEGIRLDSDGRAQGAEGRRLGFLMGKLSENAPAWVLEREIEKLSGDPKSILFARTRAKGATRDSGVGTRKTGLEVEDEANQIEFEKYAGPESALGDEQDTVADDEGGVGMRAREGKRVTPEQDKWWTKFALNLNADGERAIPAKPKIERDDNGKETGRTTVEQMFEALRLTPFPEGREWPRNNSPAEIAKWLRDEVVGVRRIAPKDALFQGVVIARAAAAQQVQAQIDAALADRTNEAIDTDTGEVRNPKAERLQARFESAEDFYARLQRENPEALNELNELQRDIEDDGRTKDKEDAEKARKQEEADAKALLEEAMKSGDAKRIADAQRAVDIATEISLRDENRMAASRVSEQLAAELPDDAPSLEDLAAYDMNDADSDAYWSARNPQLEALAAQDIRIEMGGSISGVDAIDQMLAMDVWDVHDRRVLARLRKLFEAHPIKVSMVTADRILDRMREAGNNSTVPAAGWYEAKLDRIFVGAKAGKGKAAPYTDVVLHELVHAATVGEYESNPAFRKRVDTLFRAAKRLAEADERSGDYGFTNPYEFLAEAFSNAQFRQWLESVRVGDAKATLWQRFTALVRAVLRMSPRPVDSRSVFQALVDDVEPGFSRRRVGDPRKGAHMAASRETTQRVLAAMAQTAPAKAARLAAARNYRAAAQELWTGSKNLGNAALDIMQPLLVANWDLRREGNDRLADQFFRRSGARGPLGLMNRATAREMGFRIAWWRMFKGQSPEAMAEAWRASEQARADGKTREQLAAENPLAGKIQDFFSVVDQYVQRSGVRGYQPVRGVYLPQIHDVGRISDDKIGFINFLVNGEFEFTDPANGRTHTLTEREATAIADSITTPHDHAQHADLPYAGSLMARVITDPRYQAEAREAGWLYGEPQKVVEYYIASLTKQVEFERQFGGYMLDFSGEATDVEGADAQALPTLLVKRAEDWRKGDWRVMKHLRKIYGYEIKSQQDYDRAFDIGLRNGLIERQQMADGSFKYAMYQRDMGLEIEKSVALMKYGNDKKRAREARTRIELVISGYMGQLGADMNPTRRKAQQWVMAAQTMTTLALSTVSSLPELALLVATTPDRKALADAIRNVVTDRAGTRALLEDIGYGWDQAINVAVLDNATYSVMDGLPRKIVDKFFLLNLQHSWTYALRQITAQMGMSHFKRLADAGDREKLKMYGLTPELVNDWLEHRTVHGLGGTGLAQGDLHPVIQAMHSFVDDRVIMPDAATRPTFMNDPRYALVGQLKGFFYAYGSKVLGGMARRQAQAYHDAIARGDSKGAAGVKALTPFLVLGGLGMVLAALAGELRERLKYDIWGEESPKWQERHGMDYWLYAMRQSGILGPMDMAVNLFDERSTGVLGLLGPAAGHLEVGLQHGFFSEKFLVRSTPILGQLPGARERLKELVGYDDGL